MFHQLIVLVCTIQLVLAAPQFVSFKDGKVGVNFGGYHAEAGLGGLLTGNAAHGGLSASAGTPWGPQAAAGLNGGLDGRAAGGAYAGAQLNPEIGASSVISGSVGDGQRGFAGAEAHSNGNHVSKTHGIDAPIQQPIAPASVPEYNAQPNEANSIQKIKPPKKYNVVKSEILQNAEPNLQHNDDDDSNLTITSTKTILSTVDSRHEPVNSETYGNFQPAPPSFSPADKTTTITRTVAGHVAAENSGGIISVKKNYHRERKQKLHQRRRLAHPRQRVHSIEFTEELAHPYEDDGVVPIEAALSATASSATLSSATSFVNADVNVVAPAVAHSKQVSKSVIGDYRPPTEHTVVAQQVHDTGYQSKNSEVHVNSGLVGNVLNIPIGILRSLQESLAGFNINKNVGFTRV